MGFNRLSIIDLSDRARQPMSTPDGRFTIVFNGEIYNYRRLRADLLARGELLRSTSDTEVVLTLYAQHGEACLNVLEGMFAFVVYDRDKHSLFFARDPLGQKPLLYAEVSGRLVLAQEIKSFQSLRPDRWPLEPVAVSSFLAYGSIQTPLTILEGVAALPPGHCGTWRDGRLYLRRYWDLRSNDGTAIMDYRRAKQHLRALLTQIVDEHLVSDVPVAAFLSGGVDSSIISAVVRRELGRPLQTISFGFSEAPTEYNEDVLCAASVAAELGTNHREVRVTPEAVLDEMERFADRLDQPTADGLNVYLISREARRFVTVALSGLGGDELFAGYSLHRIAYLGEHLRRPLTASPWLRTHLKALTNRIRNTEAGLHPFFRMIAYATAGAEPSDGYSALTSVFSEQEIGTIVRPGFLIPCQTITVPFGKSSSGRKRDRLSEFSLAVIEQYMQPTLLRDADILGMANSLEIRSPLVDRRLVEWAMALPHSYKMGWASSKRILVDAFRDILPVEILQRRKRGFLFPVIAWMHRPDFQRWVIEVLTSPFAKEALDESRVRAVLREFYQTTSVRPRMFRAYQRVWVLLILVLWLQRWGNARRA